MIEKILAVLIFAASAVAVYGTLWLMLAVGIMAGY